MAQALQVRPRPSVVAQEDAVRTLLAGVVEDVDSEDLQDTPARFVKAFHELTAGYLLDPATILSRVFPEEYAGPVTVTGIPFWSLCEHHLLPFHGTADVTYIPQGKVVGLSKLSRLVQCFAQRLQMQERMTRQIADALEGHLDAKGVRVTLRAEHTCMTARGARTPATMVTCDARGALKVPMV